MGIQRYEISNFARPGFESLHNLKYWQLEPYAGFGADAHSFDGVMRGQNIESPSRLRGANARAADRPASTPRPANAAEERFFVGLRLTQGIQPLAEEWLQVRTAHPSASSPKVCWRAKASGCGSPIAACLFRTKFSPNSLR